ncbi:MAG: excinuclease ABC subunit UvrA [Candidatus Nanohaloarchaea archaeon]|nr:excinuclease ABC subunit UvrA [Candidatus Nanohaloarchaea archaeon]
MNERITVEGASEHNLKDIDLEIPRGQLNVVTGVSGSGKSTLAFDTIFAEGQRRYMESLSSYARNFLDQMDKPEVDRIEGLSPAISIEQRDSGTTPRSTVGTVTEIHDHLRLLFARVGVQRSPETGEIVERRPPQEAADVVEGLPDGTKIQLLAPIDPDDFDEAVEELQERGFTKLITDTMYDLGMEEPEPAEEPLLVIDRVTVGSARSRLIEAIEAAYEEAGGTVWIEAPDLEPGDQEGLEEVDGRTVLRMTEGFSEPGSDREYVDLEQRTFSFNSPKGACPECDGLGKSERATRDMVVPDESLPLKHAIAPWDFSNEFYEETLRAFADHFDVDLETPFEELPDHVQEAVLHGPEEPIHYEVPTMRGDGMTEKTFEGAIEQVNRRYLSTSSEKIRERMREYMREETCPRCGGSRLNAQARNVEVAGHTIPEVNKMRIKDAHELFEGLAEELPEREREIADQVIGEIEDRLRFLTTVGLTYLTLDREASTLSGGETQRIRLATQIGSGLTGVLYVLDEPSIGLHRHDNDRLIDTLEELRDLGNTLLVVEHDEATIERADTIIDLGPGPGKHGGEVVAQGPPEEIEAVEESLTGRFLAGEERIELPEERREGEEFVTIRGAREHNLKDIDVEIPLGTLTAVTGLSGSGKSTLIHDILYRGLQRKINDNKSVRPGDHDGIEGVEAIESVRMIDQSPIGKTPRSNPATYTGVFDHIRELFAETREAKQRGYAKGRFSFNTKAGRCENCKGQGTVTIDMNFLSDVYVECDVCDGRRYDEETLQVEYRGKTIADVLEMDVDEAYEFFEHDKRIRKRLQLLRDVGLGYMDLGQPSPTLSGGEAQRVKLAEELGKIRREDVLYLLDEPTTGLHWSDERKLIDVLHRLVENGNSVVVIEHELELIKCADHIIDLGPEGGENGGAIVAQGTPEAVAANEESYTGRYLQDKLRDDGTR